MKNQFFYTRLEGEEKRIDSFNLDFVIRTVEVDDGSIVVMLNDGHEQLFVKKTPSGKNGQLKIERVRDYVCSEIPLLKEDAERFRILTSVD